MPLGIPFVLGNPRCDWRLRSEPEPHLGGRVIEVPRGKTLGGSSSINGMVYVRGHALDFDGWRQQGNVGWGWDDVLPYFKRSEDYFRGASDTHGAGGELSVVDPASPLASSRRLSGRPASKRAFRQPPITTAATMKASPISKR